MKNIAIIPARSGSKGLPHKNIKLLAGKPLISYTIEAAIYSGCFDTVMVSTDSEEYAKISIAYGAEIPFLRSEELSSDSANSWDVVEDVLYEYRKIGKLFDTITLLQPTSPLRNSDDIRNANKIFLDENVKAVVSVCEMDHSPLLSNTLPIDRSMENFVSQKITNITRQSLDKYYRINGAIYMLDYEFLQESNNIYRKGCYAYIMDRTKSIDIDTQIDFEFAEFMLTVTKKRGGGNLI